MKRRVLGFLLFLLIVPLFMGCDLATTTATTQTTSTTMDEMGTSYNIPIGYVTFQIITAGDDPETTEVETEYVSNEIIYGYHEGDTLFDLLAANFTIAYEESDYGRYLTAIDTLIVTEANEYIAFYINDEYSMTGVDVTDLVDESVYQFRLETF